MIPKKLPKLSPLQKITFSSLYRGLARRQKGPQAVIAEVLEHIASKKPRIILNMDQNDALAAHDAGILMKSFGYIHVKINDLPEGRCDVIFENKNFQKSK